MGDYYRLLEFGIKKQHEGRKLFFVVLHVAKMTIFKESPGVSITVISVEIGSLLVVLDKTAGILNYEEDALLLKKVGS